MFGVERMAHGAAGEKFNLSQQGETFEKCSISFKIKARESRFSGINHRNMLNILRIKI